MTALLRDDPDHGFCFITESTNQASTLDSCAQHVTRVAENVRSSITCSVQVTLTIENRISIEKTLTQPKLNVTQTTLSLTQK